MIIKKCLFCDLEFKTYPSIDSKCCSTSCAYSLQKKNTYSKYKVNCEVCGVEFLPKRPSEGGRFCSYQCNGEFNRKDKIDRSGYWYLYLPDHPYSTAQGYIAEHRIIMEGMVGRYILPDEVVHHKNGDRKDNVIGNLELMSDSDHKSHHANRERNKDGKFI